MTENLNLIEALGRIGRAAKRAEGEYTAAKRVVLSRVEEGAEATAIADAVSRLAETEGTSETYVRVCMILDRFANTTEFNVTTARSFLVDRLMMGADDSWSGRGNDAKRARFDGVRRAVRNILADLEV